MYSPSRTLANDGFLALPTGAPSKSFALIFCSTDCKIRDRSLNLLRAFYTEGLVDNRTFLAWLVQQTATCNLAQLGFVARMADEYLDGMLTCHALCRPFVDACFNKISEVRCISVV